MNNIDKIQQFIESINMSLKQDNYFSAIIVSLILPDICSKIEYNDIQRTTKRYKKWISEYMQPTLDSKVSNIKYLTPENIYELRCSMVHEGTSNPSNQKGFKKDIDTSTELDELIPYVNSVGWEAIAFANSQIHGSNKYKNSLFVDIDYFCNQIIKSVEYWISSWDNKDELNNLQVDLFSIAYAMMNEDKVLIFKP